MEESQVPWTCPRCAKTEYVYRGAIHLKKLCRECKHEFDNVRRKSYPRKPYSPKYKRKGPNYIEPLRICN